MREGVVTPISKPPGLVSVGAPPPSNPTALGHLPKSFVKLFHRLQSFTHAFVCTVLKLILTGSLSLDNP
jgi:hypothetical protein